MEYRYTPRPKNKNVSYLLLALFVLCGLTLGLGMGDFLSARAIWHFLFLLLIVAAIFLFLRYYSSAYVYVITEEFSEPMLVIYHTQGRRHSVHCRLALSHLLRVVEVPDEKSPEGKQALREFSEERLRYSYRATLGSAPTQIIYGMEGRERFAIRIEGDAAFMEALSAATARAAMYAVSEEEADDE